MPGGFHPFHAGHYALYQSAKKAFPGASLYVAATDDQSERPFPFAIKEKLAKLAGVAPGHFVQVKSPFQAKEITSHFDPNKDVLVFVRSEKDRNESPKPGGTKKDGSPAYFQPWTGKNLQPFAKHAYIAYLPTVEFGPGITSASEIRALWPTLNDQRKIGLVNSLYPSTQKNPKLAQNVVGIFNQVIGGDSQLSEASIIDVPEKTTIYYKPHGQNKVYILGRNIPGKHIDQYIDFIKQKHSDLQHAKPDEIYWNAVRPQQFAEQDVDESFGNGYPGTYEEEYGNVPMKPGGYRIHALTSEDKDKDMFIQSDPESDQLLRFAQQHYPEAGSKQKAFIKFVQRALKHSEEEDKSQDVQLLRLQKEIEKIKDAINKGTISESLDYIEEQ
jgi:hypothetical protein